MLQLKYGGYTHDLEEASVVISRDVSWNDEGVAEEIIETWDINGILQADTFATLTTALGQLEAAYLLPNKDLILTSSMGNTAHKLRFSDWDSIRPNGISYPVGAGGEYTTWRSYSTRVTAKKKPTNGQGGDRIVEYSETIEITGNGGPDWIYQPVVSGNWPSANLTDRTPVFITQSGEAVGLDDYIYGIPIFPANEIGKQRRQKRGTARKRKPVPSEYPSAWQYTYQFMGGVPFVPNPQFPR